ncbi:hypothetical protein OHD16_06890 [Sphingobacterium sp. ML3W]|uniref:hypothetical protein n=1 Tax=Sphingobacterium sp. ML3W TaxID=1538644 RepID=UPI00249A6BF6|nr:hypothetical protein [Sphingobacterium sp. ML3W]WFA79696.1 hypothetical protein OGI71_00030 [Sphingobacterium sp. ML3W]
MWQTINIKPLSVNQAWQGKRFKTPQYKAYEKIVLLSLPLLSIPKPPLKIYLEFGQSSPMADWDNPVKPFQDILQKKYGFNDKDIEEAHVKKTIVPKGQEYSKFKIESI